MTGDLILRLNSLGMQRDGAKRDTWKDFGVPIGGILRKISRNREPKAAADGDAEEIRLALPDELKEQFREAYERGKRRCESPVERLLFPQLVGQVYYGFNRHPAVLFSGETEKYVPYTVAVIPQLTIGRYRVDFALAASRKDKKIRFVVVECDGAEFHDGVANVKKDVTRDVQLLANDRVLDVVRLEGKDIKRNPRRAAMVAADAMRWAWSTKNTDLEHKFAAKAGPA